MIFYANLNKNKKDYASAKLKSGLVNSNEKLRKLFKTRKITLRFNQANPAVLNLRKDTRIRNIEKYQKKKFKREFLVYSYSAKLKTI
jgi:hypothetical protein